MNLERPINLDKESALYWGKYYGSKAKTGGSVPGFRGDIRFGRGLWGENLQNDVQEVKGVIANVARKYALPIVKYFGRKGASVLVRAGADALDGENFVKSLKKRGRESAATIAEDAGARISKFIKTGSGHHKYSRKGKISRRKKYRKKAPVKKIKRTRRKNKRKAKKSAKKKKSFKNFQNIFA